MIEAERLQNICVARATGEGDDSPGYAQLRTKFIGDPRLKDLVPRFVHSCRSLDQFWPFIKKKFPSYAERRAYLWQEFRPLLDATEKGLTSPAQDAATVALAKLDAEHVREAWDKALARVSSDPDGAITAARTLLESVCKLILDELQIEYDDDGDLNKLYKAAARSLKLGSDQHEEQLFKQILGGCATVVHGFASLRNKLGDAHGKGKNPVKAAPRHAQLAVNLAGATATFLLETFEAKHGNKLHAPPGATASSSFDDDPAF